MKFLFGFFIVIFLSFYDSQCQMYGGEWMSNLFNNINHMSKNINQNVMSMNQQMQDLQQQVNQLTNNYQRNVNERGDHHHHVMQIGSSRNAIVINSVPGNSRYVVSGYDSNGQLYYRQSEDRTVGTTLYHTERIYNPVSGTTNEFRYTLDLANPSARPVMQEENSGTVEITVN